MTSSNGNIFRVTGWIPLTRSSGAEIWWGFFICARINGWINNREAGDLRRNRAHHDVIVMLRNLPDLGEWVVLYITDNQHFNFERNTLIHAPSQSLTKQISVYIADMLVSLWITKNCTFIYDDVRINPRRILSLSISDATIRSNRLNFFPVRWQWHCSCCILELIVMEDIGYVKWTSI